MKRQYKKWRCTKCHHSWDAEILDKSKVSYAKCPECGLEMSSVTPEKMLNEKNKLLERELEFRAWWESVSHCEMLYEENPGDVFRWMEEGRPITIMQYAEKKDINDKKIFDGDIVLYMHTYLQVGFFNSHWVIFGMRGHEDLWKALGKGPVRIVGNIFENPEMKKLIGKKEGYLPEIIQDEKSKNFTYHYVDRNYGNDETGDGSQGKPWRSIKKAEAELSKGGLVIVL
jgi:hypothetical protein